MLLGKDVIGNPIINLHNGLQIGRVQDLYVDKQLSMITGVYVGSEGLLSSTPKWIPASSIAIISTDTVLVNGDSIITNELDEAAHPWVRRDELQGHPVDTKGGTKIGRVGDIIFNEEANVIGFSLDRVYVQGPLAERRALRRTAILDIGHEDGKMTIDLDEAEQQDLHVVSKLFFGDEVMRSQDIEEARKSPYADTPEAETYAAHDDKSPYIAGESDVKDDTFRSPYTTSDPDNKVEEDETFRSPYTTPTSSSS